MSATKSTPIPSRVQDLKDQRFGRLLVVAFAGVRLRPKGSRAIWRCLCDCGQTTTVLAQVLKSGDAKSCGCQGLKICRKSSTGCREDLTGQKFGRWTAMQYVEGRLHSYRCVCECGGEKIVPAGALKSGKSRSCGCLRSGKNSAKWTGYEDLSGAYWYAVQKDAAKRGHEFAITREYAWDLFVEQDKRCSLSGLPLTMVRHSKGGDASLDRIDSSVGYIVGNVQWLHKDINRMKHAHDTDYFLTLCKKVVSCQRKKERAKQ